MKRPLRKVWCCDPRWTERCRKILHIFFRSVAPPAGQFRRGPDVRFSNRPFGVKHFQTNHGDDGIDEVLSDRLELGQRSFLVYAHKAAIPGDIRRQYCR
jgi:hypothetical protein